MKTLEQLASEGELFESFESELVKQQLHNIIKQAAVDERIGRNLINVINSKSGRNYDIPVADKGTMTFRKVGEGAMYPLDAESYTKKTAVINKWANRVVVSQEMKEDANYDVLKQQLMRMGLEAGVKEDYIIFSAFADSTYGFITATTNSTSHNYSTSGTELAIVDLVTARQLTSSNSMPADYLCIHPTQTAELQQIDAFVEADKTGNTATHMNGFQGKLFGMKVLESVTTWLEQSTTQYAWVLNSKYAGSLVMRRPLTTKTYEIPARDAVAIAASFRCGAICERPAAGVRITIS